MTLTAEILYHVNDNDSVIGQVDRNYAHSNSVLHRSGVVFLARSDDRILLQHRSNLKAIFPDRHDCSSAFHVTFGESYQQAAERELKEETGIFARPIYVGKFLHCDPPENQIVGVFLCKSDEPVRIDEKEASGANFYSKDEIDKMVAQGRVTPWLRDGWKLARDKI